MLPLATPIHDIVPSWFLPKLRSDGVQVDDGLRKNVVFIGYVDTGQRFMPTGTGFFATVSDKHGSFLYVVTAEHVITGLITAGREEIWVRFNNGTGGVSFMSTTNRSWFFHPDAERTPTDVAVAPIIIHRNVDWVAADTVIFLDAESLRRNEFGVGDEIVVVGMFAAHTGKLRNIPLVRIGALAAIPEEPVYTKYTGDIEAYLVELHSIGGLSGSPVYLHRPPVRVTDKGQLQTARGQRLYLLGLMHGHFDIRNLTDDSAVNDGTNGDGRINTGVGVVVPAHKIMETLNHPELVAGREKAMKEKDAQGAQTDATITDSAVESVPPTTEGDDKHRERFTALQDAVLGKPKRGD